MEKAIYSVFQKALSAKVEALRSAAGLTQRDLAKRLRRVPSVVAHIELGQRRVDMYEFHLICLACGASPKKAAAELMEEFERLERSRKRK